MHRVLTFRRVDLSLKGCKSRWLEQFSLTYSRIYFNDCLCEQMNISNVLNCIVSDKNFTEGSDLMFVLLPFLKQIMIGDCIRDYVSSVDYL